MISRTRHVGQVGSYRLDLTHERVAHLAVLLEHVVGEVANMQDGVVHLLLGVGSEGTAETHRSEEDRGLMSGGDL